MVLKKDKELYYTESCTPFLHLPLLLTNPYNTPSYRKISPCKECGNEVGVLLPNGFTSLAECSICKHLCDVKTPYNV